MSSTRKQAKPKVVKVLPEPTKEEMLKMLTDSSTGLKQIIQDLKEDETKIAGLSLKQLPLLISETLKNLNEDCDEIDAEYKEILAAPTE